MSDLKKAKKECNFRNTCHTCSYFKNGKCTAINLFKKGEYLPCNWPDKELEKKRNTDTEFLKRKLEDKEKEIKMHINRIKFLEKSLSYF